MVLPQCLVLNNTLWYDLVCIDLQGLKRNAHLIRNSGQG